jgi:hypothetical protein
MFSPSQEDVRRFFCSTYAKARSGVALEAIETIAAQWMDEHPEYAADFADVDTALATMYEATEGRTNPFLHLSMHLSISEQCSIDQPRGIRQAVELLTHKRNSLHQAHQIRCTRRTTKPWNVWAPCCGKASAPAGRPTATLISPACNATPPKTKSRRSGSSQ